MLLRKVCNICQVFTAHNTNKNVSSKTFFITVISSKFHTFNSCKIPVVFSSLPQLLRYQNASRDDGVLPSGNAPSKTILEERRPARWPPRNCIETKSISFIYTFDNF